MSLLDLWYRLTDTTPTAVRDDVRFLEESSVFSGLPAYHYEPLLELFHENRYRSGERIFTEGDPSSALYLIKQGEVEIFQNRSGGPDEVLKTIVEGETFGELALCLESRRTASAQATTETFLLSIFRQELQEFALREPRCGVQILRNLLSVVGERLVETNTRLREMQTPS